MIDFKVQFQFDRAERLWYATIEGSDYQAREKTPSSALSRLLEDMGVQYLNFSQAKKETR